LESPFEQPNPVEQPKVVVEQPKVVVEQPKVVVEQPKVVVEQPKVVVEQPKVVVEQPKVVVEQPKVVIEQPKPVEQPKVIVEQPPASEPERSRETSQDRLRIGSSSMAALKRDEPAPRVLEEKRSPTGERPALVAPRPERVSDNIMEEVFLEITRIHDGEMSMEEVVNFVMDLAMEKVGAEAGSIMFADINGQELYFATARGPKAADVMSFRVPMGKGIAGFCAREGVSLAISDAQEDPRFYKEISDALGYPTKSLCCAPIQIEGRVFGAIELLNSNNNHFSSTEVNVLTYVGKQLARYVYDLIMARERLE
jgi:putative methionine-R-sulfoxide reductase with GAF domain